MQIATRASPFGDEGLTGAVKQRLLDADDGKLPQFLARAVDHLHQLVIETQPSKSDWRALIAFLTEVGHSSDDKRQEWILLSDLLGVSALVEELNTRRPKGATPNTVRGPFFRPDAPALPLGADISLDGKGETLQVCGRVVDLDGRPVSGATIATWQANAHGFYENQQPDLQPEFNLRGVFTADGVGCFNYLTVRPAGYNVPEDGPVGQLLHGIGYPLRRPAHLHFLISAQGFETVTTHIFEREDARSCQDPLFGLRPELIGEFKRDAGSADARWRLDVEFVLVRARNREPR